MLPFVQNAGLHREFVGAIQNTKSDDEMWHRLTEIARDVGQRLIATNNPQDSVGVALCYVAQTGPQLNFSRASQCKLVKNISTVLGATKPSPPP